MDIIVGIDEVGRGCWAGPLVAAAVLLTQPVRGLTDSKLLSKKRREQLAQEIQLTAVYGLGWVWPKEIDAMGLTAATSRAMTQALGHITTRYDQIVIDGNYNFLIGYPRVVTLIKADLHVPAVSAASILAKVARDTYMCEQAVKYSAYGFDKHVGYGTKQHSEALQLFGSCELHRLSYKPLQALLQ